MDLDSTSNSVKDVIWDTTAPPPAVTSTPLVVTINSTNVSCNGGSNGTATANVSGGLSPYTYLWQPGGLSTSSVNGLAAGTYTLTVTDINDSLNIENVTITQPSVLNAAGYVVSNIACNGGNNGAGSVSVSG